MSKEFHPQALAAVRDQQLKANSRIKLPAAKPKKITFDELYAQQQVLATIQNFIRMAIMAVGELDTRFQNPEHNKKFNQIIDNLYFIHEGLQNHPKYVFKPKDEEAADDVSGATYELNKMLAYIDINGIEGIISSIKAAIDEQKSLSADNQQK